MDLVDGFLNELKYQKQVQPNATSTAALQWAHDEIARLRAALGKIANSTGNSIYQDVAKDALSQ